MSKELFVVLAETGLTVSANVYLNGVVKASGIACAEIGVTGMYAGDFTATPNVPGTYEVGFFVGAETIARAGGGITWDGAAEVHQTGDSFARLGAAGAGLTALGDARIAHLDADVSSRSTFAGGAVASVAGSVGSVVGLTASDVAAIKAKTDNLPASPAATGDAPSAALIADAVWDEGLGGHTAAGSAGNVLSTRDTLGAGAISWSYTLTRSDTAAPIADAAVWVTTDLAGSDIIASGRTDAAGVVTFLLDAGTVYVWRQKTGFNFTNPDVETVS